jgi:D-arabinose 1-dehydrogenase-like Zn-dependent alcohol dehydrogenase
LTHSSHPGTTHSPAVATFKVGLPGTPADAEDTSRFSELTGVRPMIEAYPLDKAAEAYARMMSGAAQFRVVLTM